MARCHMIILHEAPRHRAGWSRAQTEINRQHHNAEPAGAGHKTILNDSTATQSRLEPDTTRDQTTTPRHRAGWSRTPRETKRQCYDTEPAGAGHNTRLNDNTATQSRLDADTKRH